MSNLKLNTTNGSVTLKPENGSGNVDVTIPRAGVVALDNNNYKTTATTKITTLWSGFSYGVLGLSESANNFDFIIVHYDLSTSSQTVATSSYVNDDWENVLILSPLNIANGWSMTEAVDRDKFAVYGSNFYHYRTATNNVTRAVYGVKL